MNEKGFKRNREEKGGGGGGSSGVGEGKGVEEEKKVIFSSVCGRRWQRYGERHRLI